MEGWVGIVSHEPRGTEIGYCYQSASMKIQSKCVTTATRPLKLPSNLSSSP